MADDAEQDTRDCKHILTVRKLPQNVTKRQIADLFKPFGFIANIYLKERIAKDSPVLLPNPFSNIVFDGPDAVDRIMAARPFCMGDQQIVVRRFLPKPCRAHYEGNYVSKKALVRVHHRHPHDILPDDDSIVEYLGRFGGRIDYAERLDDQTFLVQFDDYDPVDLMYLYEPHYIGEQLVVIERCLNEQRVRDQIEARQKMGNGLTNSMANNNEDGAFHSLSPVPVLSFEDRKQDLMAELNETFDEFERAHEQSVRDLKDELRSIAEERIRLQRLALDFDQARDRLLDENQSWQKLYSESLREKPQVQSDGEQQLKEIREKTAALKNKATP